MPTLPKNESTQTNATSPNGPTTANNASPAASSSSDNWVPPPPSYSGWTKIASASIPNSGQKRYAPAPDGGPPNGGRTPGLYSYDGPHGGPFIAWVPEPPLAAPADGTQANQPPPSSSSQGQNTHRDAAGKGQSGGK